MIFEATPDFSENRRVKHKKQFCPLKPMIYADIREPARLIGLLELRTEVKRIRLQTGDYITPNGAVERKTISDFIACLASGKLYEQIRILSKTYPTSYLLVEGLLDWSGMKNPAWTCMALQRITLYYRVPVLFSASMDKTAELLWRMSRQDTACNNSHYSKAAPYNIDTFSGIVINPKPKKIHALQQSLLCALPGIGKKRSIKILKIFGCPKSFLVANKKEWRKAGIGRKTAKNVAGVLEGY